MTKDNFICPCCGLPNHLEFSSKEKYNEFKNIEEEQSERAVGDFNNYIIDSNVEEIAKEIRKRYSEILDIYPTYEDIPYMDWFDKNVVCLIKEEDQEEGEE